MVRIPYFRGGLLVAATPAGVTGFQGGTSNLNNPDWRFATMVAETGRVGVLFANAGIGNMWGPMAVV